MKRTGLIFLLSAFCYSAFPQGFELAAEGAWCWFADPRALHYENSALGINATCIGYIDVHGAIKATQHNFNTGETSEVLIRSYFQPDDHNNPSFLVLPGGRIMIFYSRHTDEACFYYRISKTAGDITSLGEEKKLAVANNTTYPNPFILSNDPNHIYLCWRGINWHPTIARLTMPDANDTVVFDWGPKQILSSSLGSNVRPYAKYASDGVGNIHITYSGTHPQNTTLVPVYYGKINIPDTAAFQITLRDVNDAQLSNVNEGVFSITGNETNASYVVAGRNVSDRGWVWDIALDGNTPVIAMISIADSSLSAASRHYYYYAKWNGCSWTRTQLGDTSVRFHLSNTEYCYSGGLALDHENPNIIYASQRPNGNVFELVKYTMNPEGSSILSAENIMSGSAKNNVRPYVIPNSNKSPLHLVWMNGDYYYWIVNSSYPNGYPTSIRCDYNLYPTPVTLPAATASLSSSVIFTSASQTQTIATPRISGNFTITACIKPNSSSYSGKFFQAGDLSYHLSSRSTSAVTTAHPMPHIKIASTTYNSGNVFGSSDVWKNYSNTTNGAWYEPSKFDKVSLAITCRRDAARNVFTLTTYINGLIDQRFDVAGLTFEDVTLGGFVGEILNFKVYNTALTQDQIKLVKND
ncbi:MAG: BNR repeat-containing protein [Dysgonamonadaceae bacterium]|jgi:hypothetical protein|nr:BNR repeat-containing protein [Dysgonamonadaceae bacterium]